MFRLPGFSPVYFTGKKKKSTFAATSKKRIRYGEMSVSILIVEDDLTFSLMLKTWLGKKGFGVETAGSISHARKQLERGQFDLILSDLRLPDGDGISLLSWMAGKKISLPLIIMTGYADIQSAVQAIKSGAKDYIAKPVNPGELLRKMNEALAVTQADTVAETTRKEPDGEANADERFLEGESEAARLLYEHVRLVAPTNMSVLIQGASGTGKEYVAHRIHRLSDRSARPFVAIDCGAVPKELAASEFFGHIKGSFTGALADKTGAFEAANGGTLFLDEIGNLSYEIQVQLLRALQERKIKPVGSNKEIEVDIRLISATNENLEAAIEKGNFREDLFHRLNEFTLRVPSLKERPDDILLFANFFLDQANRELGRRLVGFDPGATQLIRDYSWPGNLRQLKNSIKRATLLARGQLIAAQNLEELQELPPANITLRNEETEKELIQEALRKADYNKSKAARLLGVDRKTLYNKLKLYNLG